MAALEDWDVASDLLEKNRIRHGLFIAHLALEKALKALVCKATKDLAPRIHNLARLAELAQLNLRPEQLDILAEMNAFNIEGRYPDALAVPLKKEAALQYFRRAEGVFQCLIHPS